MGQKCDYSLLYDFGDLYLLIDIWNNKSASFWSKKLWKKLKNYFVTSQRVNLCFSISFLSNVVIKVTNKLIKQKTRENSKVFRIYLKRGGKYQGK